MNIAGSEGDKQRKYQLSVAALIASCLSQNESVESYCIFIDSPIYHPFHGIVAEVFFKESKTKLVYAIETNCGNVKFNIRKYFNRYNEIVKRQNGNKIQFLHFTMEEIKCFKEQFIKQQLQCTKRNNGNRNPKDIFINSRSYILQSNRKRHKYDSFLNNFYLYFDQPNIEKIQAKIEQEWKINASAHSCFEKYFANTMEGLRKESFEHELLKIRLSNYIIMPTEEITFQHEAVAEWNRLTLERDVTIVRNEKNIENFLFECILQSISKVVNVNEWKSLIHNKGKLDSSTKQRLEAYQAETQDLVIQLWKENKIPLLLKTDALLPVLKEFRHLKKRFIIIDSNPTNRCLEIESYKLSVFRHLGDVTADEIMKNIQVSVQGRKPVSLFEIIKEDVKLRESITCLDIIDLMKPRRAYLQKECLDRNNYMFFIIEAANTEEHRHNEIRPSGSNFTVYCELGKSCEHYENFRVNSTYNNYRTLRLSLTDDHKLALLPRKEGFDTVEYDEGYRGLEGLFVDQNDESIYYVKDKVIIPTIGEVSIHFNYKYIPRHLSEAVKTTKENEYGLNQFTLEYSKKLLPEDVLVKSNSKIVVVTGDPGMGKTALLHSLFRSCESKYYVLFIDLARHQLDLLNGKLRSFQDVLRLSRSKCRILPYSCFLNILTDYTNRLVLILDSFDEVVATCKQQVVELIKDLQQVDLHKIIIASRLTAVNLLTANVEAKTFKVEGLNPQYQKQYINHWRLDINNFRHIPSEFLSNPLHLEMLKSISGNGTVPEFVNRWRFCEAVVKLKMDDYSRRMEPNNPDENEKCFLLARLMELALIAMFGSDEVRKYLEIKIQWDNSNFIRLGLITHYVNEKPIFLHVMFVEFFIAKWLIERVGRDDTVFIYQLIVNKKQMGILNIHSETLPLHKAVLDGRTSEVLRLCENKKYLLETDALGRSVLHIAVIYRPEILDYLIQQMRKETCNIYTCDKIMKWTWIDYLENYDCQGIWDQYEMFCIVEAYVNYYATHKEKLQNSMFRSEKVFNCCYNTAICNSSIRLIRELLSFKYDKHQPFREFRDMCLYSPMSISRKHLNIELAEEKLYGTHLVCIYGNGEAVRRYIGSGINFNKADKFNCTALHYSVMAAQNKEIIGLLLKNYGTLNSYAGLDDDTTILHMSILTGDVNVTKILLENAKPKEMVTTIMKARDYKHYTPLELAMKYENKDIITALLEYNSILRTNCMPLRVAVKEQKSEIVKLILQHAKSSNYMEEDLTSFLMLAIERENENIAQILLDHNANVNFEDEYCETPLSYAIATSRIGMIELLLRNGADVNYVSSSGWTPLTFAIDTKSSNHVIQILLDYKSDVNFGGKFGETPLYMAIERKDLEVTKLLMQEGGCINHIDSSGWTPLIHAVKTERKDVVEMLLKLNADVNLKGEDCVTSLYMAVKANNAAIVQILLKNGADVNCFDGCGISPLILAVEMGSTQIAKMLLENNADVNLKNECGVTALYAAAFKRDVAMIELLLERGADSNIITTGEDIFHNAKRTKNFEIVAWLLKNRDVNQLPSTSNDFSDSNKAASIIERVAENWDAIHLENELHSIHQQNGNLLAWRSIDDTEDEFLTAVISLINETNNKGIVDAFITNVYNNKIENLIKKVCIVENKNRNLDIIKILSRYYEDRFQLFRITIELNDDEIFDYILQYTGVDDLSNFDGNLLCVAVHKQNIRIVDRLLKCKSAMNKPDTDGFTPLMIAAAKGNREITEILLSNGADVNFEANGSGLTALYIAALIEDRYMVDMLLRYGANKKVNTCEDVLKSCVKQMQLYSMANLSTYNTSEIRNKVKNIIKEEAKIIAILETKSKYDDDTA